MSFTKATPVVAAIALALPGIAFADTPHGGSTIERASPGAGYDYVIHVQNTYDYKYNPEVRADRILLAKQIVRPFCSRNQIVGEDKVKTDHHAGQAGLYRLREVHVGPPTSAPICHRHPDRS
jgi:hypothetical protein